MAKTSEMLEVNPNDLRPYEKNAKIHGADQVEKLKASITEFGFISPCLIDKDNNIIAGHGRVLAAKALGLQKVPCVRIEGLTDEQRRAYILADNRLSELGEWDAQLVSEELEALKAEGFAIDLTGFSIDDIIFEDDETAWAEIPEAPAPVETITAPGELWALGEHRLLCGDSTKAEDVARLMAGHKADPLLTDPPYNVALGTENNGEPMSPERMKRRKRRTDGLVLENDAMTDEEFEAFLVAAFTNACDHMKAGAAYYSWSASMTQHKAHAALERAGLQPRQVLIWIKNALVLGRQDYQWRHEPCLYGWKEGGPHYFIDARSLTTVQDDLDKLTREQAVERLKEWSAITSAIYEDKPNRSEIHPTMKPLGLFKKQIRNSSREGDLVLDIFGGSGTTLIAAQELNRRCFMVEYDARFASAIIRRFEEETGIRAERIEA